MTVELRKNTIFVVGECGVEEADGLVQLLQAHPDSPVDLNEAAQMHTSIWQVLLMSRPTIMGRPANSFAADFVLPAMRDHLADARPRTA
ncbi:MAG: hypothetical protein JWM58_2503 [Rhizobium sp.]|nr:hypothetical protein [Rhizobium sp.]